MLLQCKFTMYTYHLHTITVRHCTHMAQHSHAHTEHMSTHPTEMFYYIGVLFMHASKKVDGAGRRMTLCKFTAT